jgi:hypothetical protein
VGAGFEKLVPASRVGDLVAFRSRVAGRNKPVLSEPFSLQKDGAMHPNPGRAILVVTLAADLDHPPQSCTTNRDKPPFQPTVHFHDCFAERDPCRTRDGNTPHRLSRLSLGSLGSGQNTLRRWRPQHNQRALDLRG